MKKKLVYLLSKRVFLILIAVIFPFLLKAGRIQTAYEALEIYNYFKAKKIFEKRIDNEVVAAAYGLSVIYGRNDNPFYNLDSARKYIYGASRKYPELKQDEKSELNALGVDSIAVYRWKDSIDYKQYIAVLDTATIVDYEKYIANNYNSKWKDRIIKKRNEKAFRLAKSQNTPTAYKNFIFQYPSAAQVLEAQNKYEKRLYERITKSGSLSAYETYVSNYPKSPYNLDAQDSVYKIATKKKSIEDYHDFIKRHPNNKNVEKAWRKIYRLYMKEYKPQRIVAFQQDFPNYPFKNELVVDMELAEKTFLPFKQDNRWGFMDTLGNVMIQPIYRSVENFANGLALALKEDKIGYINKAGETIIPFQYSDGESFSQGLAVVEKSGLYGLIDRANQIVSPFLYEFIGPFHSALALVANDTAYGFINTRGEVLIPLTYNYASDFKNGYALIEKDNKKGLINTLGRVVVSTKYDWLETFDKNGICRAKKDSLFGLLNKSGETVLPFNYDAIGVFSEGYAIIAKSGKYGYVNIVGEIKIPMEFDYKSDILVVGQMHNGYAKYFLDRKFGVIDTSSKKIFPAMFEGIGQYNDSSWIAVKKRGKWGYTNQQLQLMIPYQYDYAETFIGEYAKIRKNGKWGLINHNNELIVPNSYSEIKRLKNWGYLLSNDQGTKILNTNLEDITDQVFKEVSLYNKRFLKLKLKDGDYCYFNKKTKEIIRPIP